MSETTDREARAEAIPTHGCSGRRIRRRLTTIPSSVGSSRTFIFGDVFATGDLNGATP